MSKSQTYIEEGLRRMKVRKARRYAPCLSSVFQFEFRDEKQKEFTNAQI